MGFFARFLAPSYPPRAPELNVSFELAYLDHTRPQAITRVPRVPMPIPTEIVLTILEAAYYDDDLEPNDSLLSNCALVCRAWSTPAQKLLFRRISLRTQIAYMSFKSAVNPNTERGRVLGEAVLGMQIVLDHNQPNRLSQRAFAHAVSLCPNLYELNIALYGCGAPGQDIVGVPDLDRMRRTAPSFDDTTLSILKTGPRLSALQFSNWSDNHDSLTQLLDVWPSLKSLAIKGSPPRLGGDTVEPFGCQLEELRMNMQTTPSVDFMKWLLHNSVDTLRVVEFEREPSVELLDFILDAHGNALEALSLPSCGCHDQVLAIQKCERLKELCMENARLSPVLYKKLPQGMQHVALGVDINTALQPVIDVVKSSDSLDVVSVHMWAGADAHPQLPALKVACAWRGIELRFTHDIRTFRAMMRGDPLLSPSYPRMKSLDNLRLMRCHTSPVS